MPLFETGKVDLPNGEWAEIRELSVGELKEADQKGTEAIAGLMKLLPDTVVEKQLEQQQAEARGKVMDRIIRFEGYDPETLLKYGLTGWSFDEPCDDAHKKQLSARKGEIIARAIFELSVLDSGEVKRSSLRPVGDESSPNSDEPTTSIPQEASSALSSTAKSPADS